jgi:hypothetical protein
VAKTMHEFMDIDVLCDAKMFEIKARLIEVESMP